MTTQQIRQSNLRRSVQEIHTWIEDRDFYVTKGYPYEIAELYASDHMFAARRAAQGVYNGN